MFARPCDPPIADAMCAYRCSFDGQSELHALPSSHTSKQRCSPPAAGPAAARASASRRRKRALSSPTSMLQKSVSPWSNNSKGVCVEYNTILRLPPPPEGCLSHPEPGEPTD
eukprot:8057784-Pyramimonas_sp.AAC.1